MTGRIRPIPVLRWQALQDLEQAAAEARARHVTVTPGQAMVYAAKLDQARAYLAAWQVDRQAPLPPYIAAEVAAAGQPAVQRAQAIVAQAEAFHTGPGPAIEQARRAGRLAIQDAPSPEAVRTALAAAIEALQQL